LSSEFPSEFSTPEMTENLLIFDDYYELVSILTMVFGCFSGYRLKKVCKIVPKQNVREGVTNRPTNLRKPVSFAGNQLQARQ
jgi:hypothetical protein